jgi:outer membrane protein
MGLYNPPQYDVADTVTFKRPETPVANTVLKSKVEKGNIIQDLTFKKFNITLEDAVKKAFDNRPDLKSLLTKEKVATESVRLAKKDYFPALQGFANYGFGGQKSQIDTGWSFGANVNIPVFNGMLTKNRVDEARANVDVAQSNIDILKQNVYLQVQQAYISFIDAENRIPVAELTVKQAKENCDLAIGRYKVGVGNSVELQDAETNYNNAQLSYVRTFYDYNTAHAALEKAMGVK